MNERVLVDPEKAIQLLNALEFMLGLIPVAVQGSKGTQPVNQSVLSLFLFHSHRDVLNCFRFSLYA